MSYKDWYTINEEPKTGNFICVAVDKDLNFTKQYKITFMPGSDQGTCECFAGYKFCRHKKILVLFRQKNLVGTRTYYNFDREKWMTQPNQEL